MDKEMFNLLKDFAETLIKFDEALEWEKEKHFEELEVVADKIIEWYGRLPER
jgi:hypothetical protein